MSSSLMTSNRQANNVASGPSTSGGVSTVYSCPLHALQDLLNNIVESCAVGQQVEMTYLLTVRNTNCAGQEKPRGSATGTPFALCCESLLGSLLSGHLTLSALGQKVGSGTILG